MNYDVIIVGAGAAGLTAGAYTSREGLCTLLLEKQHTTGGLVQSVHRNGFVFDMGLRAIEDSGIVLPMFKELGIPLNYVKSPVSIGIEDEVMTIESKEAVDTYKKFLTRFYPESAQDIEKIVSVIKRIMKDMDVLYGIENPLFKDLKNDRQFLFKTLLPWLFKFLLTIGRINRMNTPVEKFIDTLSDNPSLKSIIGQHFFQNTPAFFAMSYFSVYLDYLYPKGGTGKVTSLLTEHILAHNGRIETDTLVTEIDPEKKQVTTDKGRSYGYKKLIWCADQKALYQCLAHSRKGSERAALIKDTRGGDSVFSLFLSVDAPPAYFKEISEGHFFYTPKTRGLGTMLTDALRNLLHSRGDNGPFRPKAEQFLKDYLELTTYEISIPVLKDPEMAPPGKTGVIVSCLLSYDLLKAVEEDGWYRECKELCSLTIIDVLSRSIYPELEKKIIERFVSTPLSIQRLTGNTDGAITGWAFTGDSVPAVNKMQRVAKSVLTPIPDVLQAGQWTYSPSGLPIAFLTGKLAANRAIKKL